MSSQPDIHRVIDLQRLLLDFRAINRIVYIPGRGDLAENDVEHSYSLAVIAWYLAPSFPELRLDRVLCLALAHDLVEVHSGDTYFLDEAGVATKAARETAGRRQLKQDWPDFPGLHACLQEYTDRSSAEACFVYALDKLLPMMLNYLGEGYGYRKHRITLDQLHAAKKDKVTAHPGVHDYYHQLRKLLAEHPHYFHPPTGDEPGQQG